MGGLDDRPGLLQRQGRDGAAERGAGLDRDLDDVGALVDEPVGRVGGLRRGGHGNDVLRAPGDDRVAARHGDERPGGDEARVGGVAVEGGDELVVLAAAEVAHGGDAALRPPREPADAVPGVDVGVDEAGEDRRTADVDDAGRRGDGNLATPANGGDAPVADDDDGVGERWRAGAVDDRPAGEHERQLVGVDALARWALSLGRSGERGQQRRCRQEGGRCTPADGSCSRRGSPGTGATWRGSSHRRRSP